MALTSLWEDRHPRPGADIAASPADVAGDWDTVVVGGGLTGLTTAALLARGGQSVLVVEARSVGAGTSGRSTAKVSLLQGTQMSRISRRHPRSVLRDYAMANKEGQAWLLRYAAEHGVEVQRRTAYTYATTERGERSARAELKASRNAGLESYWVDSPSLPFETRGAVALDDQAQLDPLELVAALAEDVRRHGGTVVEGVRVRSVDGQGPATVHTSAGDATARHVVVATNMPVLDRGGFFARAKPSRSYAVAFATAGHAVDGMYLSADQPTRSLRDAPAEHGNLLLVGGNGHTTGRTSSARAKVADLLAWTARHFPEAHPTHTWSAQDYTTANGMPYVGPLLPGRPDLLVAGGYSKWGLTNSAAAALALSARILGGHLEWAEAFDPWSMRDLRGLPDAGLVNATVGVEMARGWIRPVAGTVRGDHEPGEGEGRVRYDRVGGPTGEATVDGTVHRVSVVCPHLRGILRWNDAELSWDCPLHGSRFAPDGTLLEGPATCGLEPR